MKQFTPEHGQFVTCEINGVKIKNARVSIDEHNRVFICHNSTKGAGAAAGNKLGFNYSWFVGTIGHYHLPYDLQYCDIKPAPPRKTKAEKVREARAKKKEKEYGYLPTLELSNDDINRLVNRLNESINVIHDPYKELVEKVKEEIERLERAHCLHLEVRPKSLDNDTSVESELIAAIWAYRYMRAFIDQEEKKINKT